MAQVTKEQLLKKNAELEKSIEFYKSEDTRLREVFSDLLNSYEFTQEYGFGSGKRKDLVVQSWEGIAFLIGELKSDADYSLCLEREKELKQEINRLHEHIGQMQREKDENNK